MEYFLYKGHFYEGEELRGSTAFIATTMSSDELSNALKDSVRDSESYSKCSVSVEERGSVRLEDTDLFMHEDFHGKMEVLTASLNLWQERQ